MTITKKAIYFLRPNGFTIMKVRPIAVPAHNTAQQGRKRSATRLRS
jgi:hypothetical protein